MLCYDWDSRLDKRNKFPHDITYQTFFTLKIYLYDNKIADKHYYLCPALSNRM